MSISHTMAKRFLRPKRAKRVPPAPYALLPPTPDAVPPNEPRRMAWMVLPVLLIVGVIGLIALVVSVRGFSNTPFLFPGITMFSMIGLTVLGARRWGKKNQQSWGDREKARRDYLRKLDEVRDENQINAALQYEANHKANAAPDQLMDVVGGQQMWERRASDPDFLDVRLGSGIQEADQGSLKWEEMNIPVDEELETVAGNALRKFMVTQTRIQGMGKILNLRSQPAFSFVGNVDDVTGLVWSVLLSVAAYQGPSDVKIAVVSYRPWHWDWVKWLQHNRHDTLVDACGARRLVFESPSELENLKDTDLSFAKRGTWEPPITADDQDDNPADEASLHLVADEEEVTRRTHWIVVDDNTGSTAQWAGLMGDSGMGSVTFLRIAENTGTGIGFGPNQVFEVKRNDA